MKCIIAIISLVASTLCTDLVIAADGGTLMNEVNQLVETLVIKYPNPRNDSVMVELVRTSDEFVRLESLCKENWRSILDNLNSVIGEDAGKSMLITAFEEGLGANDYMAVLEHLSDKFQTKQISASLMKTALTPLGRMQTFLVYNHRTVRVQALLKNLRPYFDGDRMTQARITNILSGKVKRGHDEFRKAHKNLPDGNITIVFLDEPDEASSTTTKQIFGYALTIGIVIGGFWGWRYFRKKGKW